MKAMILAGGVGSRLRPMTCARPKPMMPVMDRPVMEYAVRLLKRHGVEQIGATLCYLPEQICAYFGAGDRFGVQMHYFLEKEPLGTAGGVRAARDFLDETFFVLSGDGLTDCDLSAALRFHREKKAMATIVLKEVRMPTEYGVAVTAQDGRVQSFLEKPDWSDVLSDRVNTGIYILEPQALDRIEPGVQADFSKDLFPMLMRQGCGVYGYEMQGYWCDIGDVESYLAAHEAILRGEAHADGQMRPGEAFVHESARVDGRAKVFAPCYIGPGAVVERDARIEAGAVVGTNAHVGAGAVVKKAVLWRGARLGERAQASGCVLCDGAELENGACAYEAAIIGSRSVIGEDGQVMPHVCIWPRKQTAEHERLERDVIWGKGGALRFRDGRATIREGAQAIRLGRVLACMAGGQPLLLAREQSAGAMAVYQAALSGAMSENVRVMDAGGMALPVARQMCRTLCAGAAAYCTAGTIMPLTGAGMELTGGQMRLVKREYGAEQTPVLLRDIVRMPVKIEGAGQIYLADIVRVFGENAAECLRPAAVCAPEDALLALAQQSFVRAGRTCRAEWEEELMELAPGETGIWIGENGALEKIGDGSGLAQEAMLEMLLLWTALEEGERDIALCKGAPGAARAMAQEYGAQVRCVHSGTGEELAGCSPLLARMKTDGIFAALCVLRALERREMTLADWQSRLPRMAVLARRVPVAAQDKGRVLRALAQEAAQAELGDGVQIRTGGGRVWVRPSSDRAECVVCCEAPDMEIAKEMLGKYAAMVLRTANRQC